MYKNNPNKKLSQHRQNWRSHNRNGIFKLTKIELALANIQFAATIKLRPCLIIPTQKIAILFTATAAGKAFR